MIIYEIKTGARLEGEENVPCKQNRSRRVYNFRSTYFRYESSADAGKREKARKICIAEMKMGRKVF